MKKLSLILASMLLILASCDKYNERNFTDYENLSRPKNITHYNDTLKSNEYLGGARYFTDIDLARDTMSSILVKKYIACDSGSTANVTYNFMDMSQIAGDPVSYLFETFEAHDAGSGSYVEMTDWTNKDIINDRLWECRTFSNNKYAQITANGNTNMVVSSYLITSELDFTDAIDPELAFDICVGYWTAACLKVLVSSNFDGTANGIESATWTDISADCGLPTTGNPSGYGVLTPIESPVSLAAFAGKKVHIAFVYDGEETKNDNPLGQNDPARKTTTYQIDNLSVQEKPAGTITERTEKYLYQGNWRWIYVSDVR